MSRRRRHGRAAALIAGLTAVLVSCGGRQSTAIPTGTARPTGSPIAILPTIWVTGKLDIDLTGTLLESLASDTDRPIRAARDTSAAVGERWNNACLDDLVCVRQIGDELAAGTLVASKIAQLGQVTMVRVSVFDVATGTHQRTVQRELGGASSTDLQLIADQISAEFRSPEPATSPWYAHWAVWTGAGTAVIAATAVIILVTRDSGGGDKPDVLIDPPTIGY